MREPFLSKDDLSQLLPEWLAEGLVFALEFCIEPEGQSSSSPITQSPLRLWRTAIDFVGISDCDQVSCAGSLGSVSVSVSVCVRLQCPVVARARAFALLLYPPRLDDDDDDDDDDGGDNRSSTPYLAVEATTPKQ